MHSNETKDKFVELRAAGKSFGDIAEELNVAKSTLHPWEDERADDIARLRRIQWEEVENRNGMRLEEVLLGLTMDMKDYESTLGGFNLGQLSVRETLMILRETRRAYFQTRSLLMGTPQRRKKSAEPAAQLDTAKPNKTERPAENTETQPRNTNDLQQLESKSFDSPGVQCKSDPGAASHEHGTPPNIRMLPPLPLAVETKSLGENDDPKLGQGEGQTGSSLAPSFAAQSQIVPSSSPSLLPSLEIPSESELRNGSHFSASR